MDGIFSNGKNIADTDPYYKDYVRFMGIVNYSRPAGEYFPKLTLLETMGVIVTEARQSTICVEYCLRTRGPCRKSTALK